jgi:hypothetical protein
MTSTLVCGWQSSEWQRILVTGSAPSVSTALLVLQTLTCIVTLASQRLLVLDSYFPFES